MQNFTGTGFTNKLEKLAVPTVNLESKKQAITYLKSIKEQINLMYSVGAVLESEYDKPSYNKKDFNNMLDSVIKYLENMPHD
tara:strand:- start:214 stop:459 length:246 start_codon:yes stop_codon:yes gene_type:complete